MDEAGKFTWHKQNVSIPSTMGDKLYWARVHGYPWWPCRVASPVDPSVQRLLDLGEPSNPLKLSGRPIIVVFLGDRQGWRVTPDCIEEFVGNAEDAHMPQPKSGKPVSKPLRAAIKTALAMVSKEDPDFARPRGW